MLMLYFFGWGGTKKAGLGENMCPLIKRYIAIIYLFIYVFISPKIKSTFVL